MFRVSQDKPFASLFKTQLTASKGGTEAQTGSANLQKVNINFHVTKLSKPDTKLHALCLVLQPIIVAKASQAPPQK